MRDELPQMTTSVERQEKVYCREMVIRHQLQQDANHAQHVRQDVPSLLPWQQIRTTQFPMVRLVPIEKLIERPISFFFFFFFFFFFSNRNVYCAVSYVM